MLWLLQTTSETKNGFLDAFGIALFGFLGVIVGGIITGAFAWIVEVKRSETQLSLAVKEFDRRQAILREESQNAHKLAHEVFIRSSCVELQEALNASIEIEAERISKIVIWGELPNPNIPHDPVALMYASLAGQSRVEALVSRLGDDVLDKLYENHRVAENQLDGSWKKSEKEATQRIKALRVSGRAMHGRIREILHQSHK